MGKILGGYGVELCMFLVGVDIYIYLLMVENCGGGVGGSGGLAEVGGRGRAHICLNK